MFAALRRLRAGRTTIVIAHRLSTVRDADRILVLDGGRIAAQGRHDELLKTSELYRRMCARLSVGKSLDEPETVDELIEAARRCSMRILFAGIIARYPFGGVTWCSLMYLLGLRALGHEVFYIEDTGECVYDPVLNTRRPTRLRHRPTSTTRSSRTASATAGRSSTTTAATTARAPSDVRASAADADLFINLSGGSWFWRDEYAQHSAQGVHRFRPGVHAAGDRQGRSRGTSSSSSGFDHLFTFGSNIGTPACRSRPASSPGTRRGSRWSPTTWRTDDARRATASRPS